MAQLRIPTNSFLCARVLCPFFLVIICQALASCSSVQGFANDPENSSSVLTSLSDYFDPKWEVQYYSESDAVRRQGLRDEIVAARMRAYDIEFDDFVRSLYGESNLVDAGGGLVVTAIGAVGATSGGLAAKSALNAASSGITGAQGVISKDLYYQRTIPALIAEMDADRNNAKASILLGLKQSDSNYPLVQAYADLENLKNAGGIPRAISNVTGAASTNAQQATLALQVVSNTSYAYSRSSSGEAITRWLVSGGVFNKAHQSALLAWMKEHGIVAMSLSVFISTVGFEPQRQQAIKDLSIPH